MKILVLGAAGKAAKAVIHSLRFLPAIERIYTADRDAEALCRQSADLVRIAVSPRYLDAGNECSLRARMREVDLVLGCLGPFHLHEGGIARAAIAVGVDYLSLCDDVESTREVMSLSPDAERAGVRILCGCGLTPGLSDLLARRACSRLDETDAVELAWFLEPGPDLGAATLEHLLHSYAVKAPVRRGGIDRGARAGSWEEEVEFPPPVGTRFVSHLAHPEPLTLGGALAVTGDVWFKAGMGSRAKGLLLQALARLGEGARTELERSSLHAVTAALARRGRPSFPTALRVTARGTEKGGVMHRTLCVAGDYYRISGLVMAAAVEGMVRDSWAPGVHTAHEVLDNPRFFAWLSRAGQRILVGEACAGGSGEGCFSPRAG
ncbi:MAG: saccharopine dehydrogenase NADP-binding domain-containing protein [Actinomycetota bacterium]|nr:saccharopine dehydrogenase NADP-binding domain-containing protein [Actinomycetota bacterium]MDD5666719.1 saccharopine dehydrogenase NADP-binding domain-containing protein [Actinomycetota bacterium]